MPGPRMIRSYGEPSLRRVRWNNDMGWFHKICRDMGLMLHNIRRPDGDKTERHEVQRKTQEKRQGDVTLRRTTIDEIEIHKGRDE